MRLYPIAIGAATAGIWRSVDDAAVKGTSEKSKSLIPRSALLRPTPEPPPAYETVLPDALWNPGVHAEINEPANVEPAPVIEAPANAGCAAKRVTAAAAAAIFSERDSFMYNLPIDPWMWICKGKPMNGKKLAMD